MTDARIAGSICRWINSLRTAAVLGRYAHTGAAGRQLFHPLRLAISGRDSGPELKQLIPLLEAGARLALEPAVAGVAERIERALGSRRS